MDKEFKQKLKAFGAKAHELLLEAEDLSPQVENALGENEDENSKEHQFLAEVLDELDQLCNELGDTTDAIAGLLPDSTQGQG